MTETNPPLATIYAGWQVYQDKLVAAIRPLTPEQLAWQSRPQVWSVGTIVAHIAASRVYWFHSVLGEGSPELEDIRTWDEDGSPPRTGEELVTALETTWHLIHGCLSRWSTADLAQTFRPHHPDAPLTPRQWVIWHLIEHDLHHGGEISFALGLEDTRGLDL